MSSFSRIALIVFIAALVLVLTAGDSTAVSAQCALCKTAVDQIGSVTARSMNIGILVLLVPPVAIFCAIFAVAYRGQQSDSDGDDGSAPTRRY